MSFFVKYATYPEKIDEVRMEFGSPFQYQTIQAVEKVPAITDGQEEPPKEYEVEFRIVDNHLNSVTAHKMNKEELGDYIAVLRQILSQIKN